MEIVIISRLLKSFIAIEDFFVTTKRYMLHIIKMVFFIEEVVPLLHTIHANLHQTLMNKRRCKIDSNLLSGDNAVNIKKRGLMIRTEIDSGQEDQFSIMNTLQFYDITTQMINSVASTTDNVKFKAFELLECSVRMQSLISMQFSIG